MSLTIKVHTRGDSEDNKGHNITCGLARQKTHAQIGVAAVSQCSASHRTPMNVPNRRSIVSIDTCRTLKVIAAKRVICDAFVFKVNDVLIS